MYRIHHYLDRLAAGIKEEEFVREFPHPVLVELEGTGSGRHGDVAVTEQLNPAELRRQSLTSRDSKVFVLEGRAPGSKPIRVGRSAPCEVILDHPSVSKEHAHLIYTGGGLLLEDQGSTNGTFLNNKQVDAGKPTPLRADDTLAFGRATGFQYLEPDGFYRYLDLLRRFIGL